MIYFIRNDVNLRNEWTNYTNWPYSCPPINVQRAEKTLSNYTSSCSDVVSLLPSFDSNQQVLNTQTPTAVGPGMNPNGIIHIAAIAAAIITKNAIINCKKLPKNALNE